MGWWISLEKDGEYCEVPFFKWGGTVPIDGTSEASISVTYNYSLYYYQTIDKDEGIRWLNGRKARETIERLENSLKELGSEFSGDYWEQTPGNAGRIIDILLTWAYLHPEAIWRIN